MCAQSFSCVLLFETPWIVAFQAPLTMEFSRGEYMWGCHFLIQGMDLLDPRIKPKPSASPALADGFFTTEPPGRPIFIFTFHLIHNYHISCEWHSQYFIYLCVCIYMYVYIYLLKEIAR